METQSTRFNYKLTYVPKDDDEKADYFMKYCRFNKKGNCKWGRKCKFAHCMQEKRTSESDPLPMDVYKMDRDSSSDESFEDWKEWEEYCKKITSLEAEVKTLKFSYKYVKASEESYKKQLSETNKANQKNIQLLNEANKNYKDLYNKFVTVKHQKETLEEEKFGLETSLKQTMEKFKNQKDQVYLKKMNKKVTDELFKIKRSFGLLEGMCRDVNQNNFSEESKTGTYPSGSDYQELISKLEKLLECPIGLSRLSTPVVLPSGVTVEKLFMTRFIQEKAKDPYNKNLTWKFMIENKLAKELREIIDNTKQNYL